MKHDPVVAWLLDSDPSIRWQALRDLTDTDPATVATERARVASEGWGRLLLDQQRPDGQWGDGVAHPFWWIACLPALALSCGNSQRTGGDGARFFGGDW